MSKKDNFLKTILSGENGILSSKRLFGGITILVVLGCIITLVIKEGGTNVVENLLITAMILGASLLGISSVSNILSCMGKKKNNMGENTINKCNNNSGDNSSPQSK